MRKKPIDDIIQEEEDTQHGKYLTFYLGKDCFGIAIEFITEIVGIQPITQVPGVPGYLKGIINLRGSIIPVMDVRIRFGKEPIAYDDRTCIVVSQVGDTDIGLIVDRVAEVVSIADEQISAPPEFNKSGSRFINGIARFGSEVKLLLDSDRIISDEEISAVLGDQGEGQNSEVK